MGEANALDHPHILKLYEVYEDQVFFYLVLELISGGDLEQYVEEHGPGGWQRVGQLGEHRRDRRRDRKR